MPSNLPAQVDIGKANYQARSLHFLSSMPPGMATKLPPSGTPFQRQVWPARAIKRRMQTAGLNSRETCRWRPGLGTPLWQKHWPNGKTRFQCAGPPFGNRKDRRFQPMLAVNPNAVPWGSCQRKPLDRAPSEVQESVDTSPRSQEESCTGKMTTSSKISSATSNWSA